MNTHRKLIATIVIAGLPAWAAAQSSSVTLAGVADAAARNVSNEGRGSLKSLVSGSNSTSRVIVRGSEDLGGGLSASFHLEHGILLDSGTQTVANQFWDRRATVSLASRTLGELRAGRDFIPSYLNWSRFDPFGYIGAAGANNFINGTPLGPIRNAFSTNPNTTVRSSNAVQVLLPGGLGGVEGGLMVAAGEGGAAANGQHRVVGGRLGWAGGGLLVSAALTETENNLTGNSAFKDTAVGASYVVGPVRLSAAWRQFKLGTAKQTQWLAGAVATVGAGEIKLSYNRVDMSGRSGTTSIDANDATQIGLGYVHSLSRRSALYAHAARIGNKGAAAYAVPGGPAAPVGGGSSTGFEFGVRHTF
jgi:predicted porin